MSTTSDRFPTDVAGLPEAGTSDLVELADGDRFELRIAPVAKRLGDATVRMLGYNGSIPGPVLKVKEGAEITVDIENQGDMEATVHWHGLRLENRFDGTHETQAPVPVGERGRDGGSRAHRGCTNYPARCSHSLRSARPYGAARRVAVDSRHRPARRWRDQRRDRHRVEPPLSTQPRPDRRRSGPADRGNGTQASLNGSG